MKKRVKQRKRRMIAIKMKDKDGENTSEQTKKEEKGNKNPKNSRTVKVVG